MYMLDFAETGGLLRGFAFHTLDLRLVWDRPSAQAANAVAEAELAAQMSQVWAAFLRGGEPSCSGLPAWPEYRIDARLTMVFDTASHVEQASQPAELRLWDGVL